MSIIIKSSQTDECFFSVKQEIARQSKYRKGVSYTDDLLSLIKRIIHCNFVLLRFVMQCNEILDNIQFYLILSYIENPFDVNLHNFQQTQHPNKTLD